jgi:hypothetical protein
MVGQFFRPSWLGLLLMLLIVIVLTAGFTVTTSSATARVYKPGETPGDDVQFFYRYGMPTVLEVRTAGPTQDVQHQTYRQVYWSTLLLVMAGAYVVAMPIGRWITGYRDRSSEFVGPLNTGWRSPAVVMLAVWLVCAVTAAAVTGMWPALRGTDFTYAQTMFGAWLGLALLATPVTLIVMIVRRWRWRRGRNLRGFDVTMAPVEGAG